ncbi:hypothetical protein CKO28_09055 [Rhodovibrio sodomensis]|uniref:Uncharacterized protein n=2 Tax=Rhodovibrio sodomensis TaxID=1088 RepID=A0ABS1DCM8_9PROT|nr:hypothetical protein [Rhodovibrio sodomensis]
MAKIPPVDYASVYHRYHTLDESLPMIARSYACSRSTVLKAMKKFESQVAAEQGLEDPNAATTSNGVSESAGGATETSSSNGASGSADPASEASGAHASNGSAHSGEPDTPAPREPSPTARIQTAASASLIALPGQADTSSSDSDKAAEKTSREGRPRLSGTLKLRAKPARSHRTPANYGEATEQAAEPPAQDAPAQAPTQPTPAPPPGPAGADRSNLPEPCRRLFEAAEALSVNYADMMADPTAERAERLSQTIHGLRRVIARIEIDKDRQLSSANRTAVSAK